MKKYEVFIIAAMLFGIFFACFVGRCHALEWEIGDYQGFGSHKGVDYWQNTVTLKGVEYVYNRTYLGGRVDYTRYSFGNRCGLSGLLGNEFAKYGTLTFYTEGYGGLAVGNGWQTLERQHHNLLKSGPYGIFGAEIGIRYKKVSVSVAYDHTSSLKAEDKGLNCFGPRIGVRW